MEFNYKNTIFFSQNVEALLRYSKLFNEFLPSLKNVKDLLKDAHEDLKLKMEKRLESVTKEWENLLNDMVRVIKVINPIDN